MRAVMCACGCGEVTPIAGRNRADWGYRKGEHVRYVRGHNSRPLAREGHKWCTRCGLELPWDRFYVAPGSGKRQAVCRDCAAVLRRETPRRPRPPSPRVIDAVTNRARVKRWRQQNPDKRRRQSVADAARRRGAPLDALARGYVEVIATDPCVYCGGPAATVDHIVPVASGGTSEWSNLSPACGKCNSAKGSRSLLLYLATRP